MLLTGNAVMNKNVVDWPESSSATTSRGSDLFVAAITAGASLMQIIEPASAKIAIMIDIAAAGEPKHRIR